MKWFLDATVERRLNANPYAATAALAARHPRPVLWGTAAAVGSVLVAGLIALSSLQAFLAMSHHSATNRTRLLNLAAGDGDAAAGTIGDPAAPAAAAGLATAPLSAGGPQPSAPVGRSETVVVHGIRVHVSIAANLRALIDHAAADGVTLSGWGWRDPQTQIRLRRQHCGTSNYAIYDMPSSRCRPPTARPGRSQHERGLAIDFTFDGRSISTRRNAGFRWLQANAATYGFKNLASEPWHWSTTGR